MNFPKEGLRLHKANFAAIGRQLALMLEGGDCYRLVLKYGLSAVACRMGHADAGNLERRGLYYIMTPQQRRKHRNALDKVAKVTHKRYLGRPILLTGIQSAWIKSLLTIWGESMRGEAAPRKPTGHSCWRMMKGSRWSDKALERFTAALKQAREEGFRGQLALNRARSILWPQPAISVIDTAIHNDDVEFVEQCVLQAFDESDPVYVVGVSYYTSRKKISDITRELLAIAPWLTPEKARERVKWCLQIFRAKVYLSARKLLDD